MSYMSYIKRCRKKSVRATKKVHVTNNYSPVAGCYPILLIILLLLPLLVLMLLVLVLVSREYGGAVRDKNS